MEFEEARKKIIGVRVNNKEFEKVQEVCGYYNITYTNLFRSLFKTYYKEFKENEKQEK